MQFATFPIFLSRSIQNAFNKSKNNRMQKKTKKHKNRNKNKMEHKRKAANYCLTSSNYRAAAKRLTKKSDLTEQFVLFNQRRMAFHNILLDGGEIKHHKQPRQYEHAPVIASKLFILVQNIFFSIIFQKLANYT